MLHRSPSPCLLCHSSPLPIPQFKTSPLHLHSTTTSAPNHLHQFNPTCKSAINKPTMEVLFHRCSPITGIHCRQPFLDSSCNPSPASPPHLLLLLKRSSCKSQHHHTTAIAAVPIPAIQQQSHNIFGLSSPQIDFVSRIG
jgi:hypothetical protein